MSQATTDEIQNQSTTVKRKGGRPQVHDREKIWDQLLRFIADEGESLPGALARLPSPRPPTIFWAKDCLRRDAALARRYAEAQAERADTLGERLIGLADAPLPPGLQGAELIAAVNMRRLQIDVRKFVAAKLNPKKWSERMQVEVDVTQRISVLAALEQAERRVHSIVSEIAAVEDARIMKVGDK
jgi:hypothetical protein